MTRASIILEKSLVNNQDLVATMNMAFKAYQKAKKATQKQSDALEKLFMSIDMSKELDRVKFRKANAKLADADAKQEIARKAYQNVLNQFDAQQLITKTPTK